MSRIENTTTFHKHLTSFTSPSKNVPPYVMAALSSQSLSDDDELLVILLGISSLKMEFDWCLLVFLEVLTDHSFVIYHIHKFKPANISFLDNL